MPWIDLKAALAPAFAHRDRMRKAFEDADMFGRTLAMSVTVFCCSALPGIDSRQHQGVAV